MFLFLARSVFSHYFNFASLRFIIYLAFVIDTARCGLADDGRHSWRAATERQPGGMNADKGGGYTHTFPNKDVELKAFSHLKA